jgi:hypothetical protein
MAFSILDYVDELEPSKDGKYICPACGGNDFSINKNNGAYTCWHDPSPAHRAEVRDALPLSLDGRSHQGIQGVTPLATKTTMVKKLSLSTVTTLPAPRRFGKISPRLKKHRTGIKASFSK